MPRAPVHRRPHLALLPSFQTLILKRIASDSPKIKELSEDIAAQPALHQKHVQRSSISLLTYTRWGGDLFLLYGAAADVVSPRDDMLHAKGRRCTQIER